MSENYITFAHFFPLTENMNQMPIHIESLDPEDCGMVRVLGGFGDVLKGVQEKYIQLAQEKHQYKSQAEASNKEATNIIAEGKQSELIAALNVLYEYGMVACTKKEYMQRMADALGCPSIADYSRPLNKVKQTYKYEELFDKLKETALKERDKND